MKASDIFHVNRHCVKYLLVCLVVFTVFVGLGTANAATGVPSILSYQGRLADPGGNLLGGTGTPYFFKFSFWDSPTVGQGNKLWPATSPGAMSLTVKQGVFYVNIGDTDGGYH